MGTGPSAGDSLPCAHDLTHAAGGSGYQVTIADRLSHLEALAERGGESVQCLEERLGWAEMALQYQAWPQHPAFYVQPPQQAATFVSTGGQRCAESFQHGASAGRLDERLRCVEQTQKLQEPRLVKCENKIKVLLAPPSKDMCQTEEARSSPPLGPVPLVPEEAPHDEVEPWDQEWDEYEYGDDALWQEVNTLRKCQRLLTIELTKGVQQEIHYVKAFAVLRQRVERLERCFVTDIWVMPAK